MLLERFREASYIERALEAKQISQLMVPINYIIIINFYQNIRFLKMTIFQKKKFHRIDKLLEINPNRKQQQNVIFWRKKIRTRSTYHVPNLDIETCPNIMRTTSNYIGACLRNENDPNKKKNALETPMNF